MCPVHHVSAATGISDWVLNLQVRGKWKHKCENKRINKKSNEINFSRENERKQKKE
jgi:hypothetical protein